MLVNALPPLDGSKSPWERRFGSPFGGVAWPFGASADYRVSRPSEEPLKFEPVTRAGLFLGYFVQPGFRWSGDYMVIDLHELTELSKPAVRRVRDLVFPLLPRFPFALLEMKS